MRVGGWLFAQRSWLPIPLVVVLLLLPPGGFPVGTWALAGAAIVIGGELLRFWAVQHIGVISRTRSDRLGPLVTSGPFGLVRNPLYIGNIALWVGFAVVARQPWSAVAIAALLGFEYHAIVRWEERLLESRRGQEYRDYCARVPRWLPSSLQPSGAASPEPHSLSATVFSERGTLIAIVAGFLLLAAKTRFVG